MTDKLLASLNNEKTPVTDIFRDWRKCYNENHVDGTRHILQLCVDMTGYSYVIKAEDFEQAGDMNFVLEHVVKSSFQEVDVLMKPAVLERLYKLLELMIVHNSQELLQDNVWLNRMIRLMVAFCEADEDDECNMVGGFLSTFLMVHVSAVRQTVQKELEKSYLDHGDSNEIERRERNLHKCTQLLIRNIEIINRFTTTLPSISDLYCRVLVAYPGFYVENGVGLKVLLKLLQCRHGRTFALVINCLKNLLNQDVQSNETVKAVTNFFIESDAHVFFVQGMLNFKSHERQALEVILLIQNQFQGRAVFDKDVTNKLRQFMFHADDQVRGYAIDFHVSTLCRPDDDQSKDGNILLHILKLYVTYEHSIESLKSLVTYLWNLDFFETWDVLFDLLIAETAEKDNLFLVYSIVLVVNHCHELFMQNFESQEHQPVDREKLRRLLKSFMQKYPEALRSCIPYECAYSDLLKPASAEHHRKIMSLKVDVEPYYEALFDVLETVARTGVDFCMLVANLKAIRRYGTVIVDTEQIWSELLTSYASTFIETRQKITSANVGKDLLVNETYYQCMVRVTAMLELDHEIGHANLNTLMKMAVNDFNLLEKFKFNRVQTAMFYRFYKSTFYALLHAYQPIVDSGIMIDLPRFTSHRLKRRVLELLRILIKHLGQYDEPLEVCLHMFTTLCDILLMTQTGIAELDIPELAHCEYNVDVTLLERMAKYLLNYLISKEYDVHELAERKQKQLLEKYIDLYRNHRSLPRITDTYHIVANFCFQTQFEPQLKRLMIVLYRVDPAQFGEVISQAAYQLLLFYKSEPSVKNLFKKFKAFVGAELTEHADESASVVSRVVEKILNYLMASVIGNADDLPGAKKMLKLIEPMLSVMPCEELVKMEHLLMRRTEYEKLKPAERKVIDKFVKHLRKCADA